MRGGGGRWKFLLTEIKCSCGFGAGGGGWGFWGCLGRPTSPPGGRVGSENNTLLPMTMTHDLSTFWNVGGPTLSYGNLGGGRIKIIKILTKP